MTQKNDNVSATAKELAQESALTLHGKIEYYVFTPEGLQEYADAFGKEQRKQCLNEADIYLEAVIPSGGSDAEHIPTVDPISILNAKQPEAL